MSEDTNTVEGCSIESKIVFWEIVAEAFGLSKT
jgi:hypothetical protein